MAGELPALGVLESSKAAPIFGATLRALEELRGAEDSPSSMFPFSQLRVKPHNRFRFSSSSSTPLPPLPPCCYDCENYPHPVAVDLITFEARLTAIFSWTTLLLPCFSSSSLHREGKIVCGALKPKPKSIPKTPYPICTDPIENFRHNTMMLLWKNRRSVFSSRVAPKVAIRPKRFSQIWLQYK